MVNLASFGAFLGGNNGSGGLAPGLLANQKASQERQQAAAAYQALAQLAKSGQSGSTDVTGGAAPQGLPGSTPMPGGGAGPPTPSAGPSIAPAGTPTPTPGSGPNSTGVSPMPGGAAQSQRFDPEQNMAKQIAVIAGIPGLSDDQRMAALMKMSAYTSPIDKAEQTLQQKQDQINMQQERLNDTLANIRYVKGLEVSSRERGQDIRSSDTERGQDMNAGNNQARIAATERGQDIRSEDVRSGQDIQQQRADTYEQGTAGRLLQGEEGLRVKQQNADTASDRAGTYKYGTLRNTDIRQQNADTAKQRANTGDTVAASRVKMDDARVQSLASKVSAENKKPFDAAKTTYNKAASLYQSLTAPGRIPAASVEDIKFAKDKMDAAQDKMEQLASTRNGASPAVDPKLVTPENLQHTAEKYGITVEEVKKRLGVQ